MRRPTLVLTLLLVASALAGCAEQPGDGGPTTPASTTPASTTPQMPTSAGGGEARECVSTEDGSMRATEPTVVMRTSQGTIRLTLFCDKAPVTTQHLVQLIEAGCWDGTKFHRVVRGFMNQGGDPLTKDGNNPSRWGTGGPSDCGQSPDTIPEEYYCRDGTISQSTPAQNQQPTQCDAHGGLALKHDDAGVWSMARTSAPHTSGSQFFLTAAPASFLDGRYTVFGHTADEASTQVVQKINNLPCNGQPCQDPNSRTDTLVVVEDVSIEWG